MSFSASAKKRVIALHGWSATILSILLYVVMLTGTVIVFDNEIRAWSQGTSGRPLVQIEKVDELIERFALQVPQELHQAIEVTPTIEGTIRVRFTGLAPDKTGRLRTFARIFYVNSETGSVIRAQAGQLRDIVSSSSGRALEEFLVDLHVRLHVPGNLGLYLTGISGMAMLIAAITGVLIHRHLFKEMFVTERPGKRLVSARDKHNLAGVWSLPFAVLLAFTGAFLSFATSLGLPIVAISAFGGDQDKALAAVVRQRSTIVETTADMMPIDLILAKSNAKMGSHVTSIRVENRGKTNAEYLTTHAAANGALGSSLLRYNAVSGDFISNSQLVGSDPSFGNALVRLVAPLHYGNFAGYWSRIVWAALGAAMTYTIVSGLQLWLKRRSETAAWQAGEKVLNCVVWGLPLAMVGSAWGYFLTRLVGLEKAGTVNGFLIISAMAIGAAIVWRARPVDWLRVKYIQMLGVSLFLLPLLRLQTGGMSWGEAVLYGGNNVLFIDVLVLIGGSFFSWYGGGLMFNKERPTLVT